MQGKRCIDTAISGDRRCRWEADCTIKPEAAKRKLVNVLYIMWAGIPFDQLQSIATRARGAQSGYVRADYSVTIFLQKVTHLAYAYPAGNSS